MVHIAHHPGVLAALSPHHALLFMWAQPITTFIILGAVVLCVTGAEALYADMGHFGKRPIRIAWFWVVMPALTLNYFGQGALLLSDPSTVKNPFFLMAPAWFQLPLVVLATAASVIASQALISGAFSVTKQVIQLGYLPRMQIEHTSVKDTGQIYIASVNWSLFVAIVLAVLLFRNSSSLAAAYGIAVCTDMLITTVLTFFVIRHGWKYPLSLCIAATGFFFLVDLAFWGSNLLKLADGGWFPLAIGGFVFTLMATWKDGRSLLNHKLKSESLELPGFLDAVFTAPPARVEGTAVFLCAEPGVVPNALLHNLKHNKVLHEQNLFVTVCHHETPWIGMDRRTETQPLGHGCWQVTVNYGFKNDPDLPKALEQIRGQGCEMEPMTTSYFLSRDTVIPTMGEGMAPWREKLFAQMHHNASGIADFLKLPNNAVVELGSKIEI
jgi:KUP system potassium uptake protein